MHRNFDTQDPQVNTPSLLKTVQYFWRFAKPYPFYLGIALLLGIGVALSEGLSIGLIFPFIEGMSGDVSSATSASPLGFLTPYFQEMSMVSKIRTIAIALVVLQTFKAIFVYIGRRIGLRLQINIDRDLRIEVFDDLLSSGIGFINNERIASLFTILNNYTAYAGRMTMAVVSAIPIAVTMLAYVTILFLVSWQLTLVGLALVGLTSLLMGKLSKWMSIYGRRMNQAAIQLNHVGFESLTAMRIIKLFAREDHARNQFEETVNSVKDRLFDIGKVQALSIPLYQMINVVMLASLLIVATFVLAGSTTFWVEVILIFVIVIFRLMGPVSNLNSIRVQVAGNMPAIEAVMEFFERRDKQYITDGAIEFDTLKKGVSIEGLSFRYSDDETHVLSDVTFEIPKGKMTAIVGASGSGKSTFISLLARLYDPTKGRILLDGTDLREYKAKTWRRRIGIVSQDTFLFNDTIRSNIRYGRLDATDEEIDEAAIQANAHDFIMEMTDGYETLIGDRGVRLSGGQAQRIAIARAILVNPELLVLDEATSSLDTASERLVQGAIDRISQDRTVLAVAHRLSTIRRADNIVVIEQGKLAEQGSHEKLIAIHGKYWQYVQLQDLGIEEDVAQATKPS